MTDFSFTSNEQDIINDVRGSVGDASVRLPEGNVTHPGSLRSIVEQLDEWWGGWFNEDDPSSPYELNLIFPDTLTFEQGLNVAGWADVVFAGVDAQVVDARDGQVTFRIMFDNPTEIFEGDLVREQLPVGAEGEPRTGIALLVGCEDEPSSLRVNVRWDGDEHSQWVDYADVAKIVEG